MGEIVILVIIGLVWYLFYSGDSKPKDDKKGGDKKPGGKPPEKH